MFVGSTTPWILLSLAALSVGCAGLAVWGGSILSRVQRQRDDLNSIQAVHEVETARLGGLVVAAPIVAGALWLMISGNFYLATLGLTALPIFLAGLAEDLGFQVSAKTRLFASAASAGLVVLVMRVWVTAEGAPFVEAVFAITPLAIGITIFGVAGICHAMNLIDGVNGLAGGLAMAIALALSFLAHSKGAPEIAAATLVIAVAVLGFLVFNWPKGLLFLGDSGAYLLGHMLAWLAIALASAVPSISAIALSLMFFWPIADTLAAIERRHRRGRSLMDPDRMHFHHVVLRGLRILSEGRMSLATANALTGAVVLAFGLGAVFAALVLYQSPRAALYAWMAFGAAFALLYWAAVRLIVWLGRRRPQQVKAQETQPLRDPGG